MNNDKGSKSNESTPRNEQDDLSGRQLKSLSRSEGPETWSNAESSVGSSGRRRPSSWDDSDDDSPTTTINSFSHNGLIYSGRSQKQARSVTAEINEIKTQYFKNLDAVGGLSEPGNSNFEARTRKNVENKRKTRSKVDPSDRRQSPARVRRRTKSSSESSAILEPAVECSSSQFKDNFQSLTHDSYQYRAPRYQSYSSGNPSVSTDLEFDPNDFLDHIFAELRTKKMGLFSLGEESSLGSGSRGGKMLDLESCSAASMKLLKSHDLARTFPSPAYNPLTTLESFDSEDPVGFIHKTSRKLSKILEVEETKKSQEGINILEEEDGVQLFEMSPFLWANPEQPPDDVVSPFLTSNDEEGNTRCWTSIISLREKSESPTMEIDQVSPKNSEGEEKPTEEMLPENQTKEKLSERFYNLFSHSDSDNDSIIFLTEKTAKTQLGLASEKEENISSPKDSEEVKHSDGIERQASWEIVDTENVISNSEKVDVEENQSSVRESNDSGTRQKSSRHVKAPSTEVEKSSQEGRISNRSEETILSWSGGSTPRRSSRHSLVKSSQREREPDLRLEIEGSNLQPQALTSRSLKTELTPVHSSREGSFRPKDESMTLSGRESSKGSSRRTCDNLNPERAEDKPNVLNINLIRVHSDSGNSTESNSSSSRTSDQPARSSHTSEPTKNQSSKQIQKFLYDSPDPDRMKGSKTERPSKSQKISSPSLISSKTKSFSQDFGNFERRTEWLVDPLKIRERQTSANSERISTATVRRKSSNETKPPSRNSTNSCRSVVLESSRGRLIQDTIEDLKSPAGERESHDDVTTTFENMAEKLNSSRSEKTGAKWNNDKRFGGVREGLSQTRSEETMRAEDSRRNLLLIQTKVVIPEDPKSCRKDCATERDSVTGRQFSDVTTVEESVMFFDEKSSLSPSSLKELTIPIEDISCSLEKIEIESSKSVRENEETETEENEKSSRTRRTGRLSNESLSNRERETPKIKPFSGQTSNRTVISNVSSEPAGKLPETGSYRDTKAEGSQTLVEKLKTTVSMEESLGGHESPKESMASKSIFQEEFNEETWNRLIDAFEGTQKLGQSSENRFPGFPSPNQKEFTEQDREETQDFCLYEPDEVDESEDIFTLSGRLMEAERKSWLRSPNNRERKARMCETLAADSINLQLEHSEGRIILKSNEEKSVHEHDSKRRNFEIGEFGDGNCWHDGKPDISEPEKPQNHGDGNQERRNNWETLVLNLQDNNEEREAMSRRHTWMEVEGKTSRPNSPEKNKNANSEPNFFAHNLNHSKSENSLPKIWSQQRESFKTWTNTSPMKGNTKRKSRKGDCSEESFSDEREHQLGKCHSIDESKLFYGKNPENYFESVTSEAGNRKQEKESTNLDVFLAGQRKGETNNWLIIKNQEGKQSKRQKENLRKLKKKLKKCQKLNSTKEPPLYMGNSAAGKLPAFVPALKFRETGCLQNLYKRLFSICCLTSDSSAATSL